MENITELIGKTLIHIIGGKDYNEIKFYCSNGQIFRMYHDQDCCENVTIDDIVGDINDLIGSIILKASEDTNINLSPKSDYDDSYTWTFYNISTIKGTVTIRWYGTSNGYYSESVYFEEIFR